MTRRAAEKNNDRLFCWEQVSATNRLFRVSRVFAPRSCVDKLLPLYALFSAVEQVCSTIADEDVASSKLNYWRSELLHQDRADSQHPLVKELCRTGASGDLKRESIAALLDAATSRLSVNAPPDQKALKEICVELYRPQLEMELDVCGLPDAVPVFSRDLLARNGMTQLFRESTHRKEEGGFWWVPLNLLARHSISREEIVRNPRSAGAVQLLRDVLADDTFAGSDALESSSTRVVDYSSARHVFAISGLYSRKLRLIKDFSADSCAAELERVGPADLLDAWKSARKAG